MELSLDELAGIADLFGGLTRAELQSAVENIAARQGVSFDPDALERSVDEALREYYLVGLPEANETVLAAGPAALPTLPEHGEDLPHMMDCEPTHLGPERLADALTTRLEADVDAALSNPDDDRLRTLLDVCYAAEAWTAVEVEPFRTRLLDELDDT